MVLRKAVAEPHYCDTYADLLLAFKLRLAILARGGDAIGSAASLFICVCQSELEEMSCSSQQELAANSEQRRRIIAKMKLMGKLFIRRLICEDYIVAFLNKLICPKLPNEFWVECVCELVINIAKTFESSSSGRTALNIVCDRLLALHESNAYSKRIRFIIQDVLESSTAGWLRTLFQPCAKTKHEIRRKQEIELDMRNSGWFVATFENEIAGATPEFLRNVV